MCVTWLFTGDLFDAGETVNVTWGGGGGGGAGNSTGPRRTQQLCMGDQPTRDLLEDGTETLTLGVEGGSVTVAAVMISITGDSTAPVGYRVSTDSLVYTVSQGSSVAIDTTATDDPDAPAPPAVTLTARHNVSAGSFSTVPAGGTPTFTSDGTLSTSSSTNVGGYQLIVTAKGAGFTRSTEVFITVEAGGGGSGTLSGTLTAASGNVNLTNFGTQDWAIWGYGSAGSSTSLAPDVRKSGSSGISNLTDIDPAPDTPLRGLGQFPAELEIDFTWSDGSATACATGVHAGLQHDGQTGSLGTLNDGFSFTVPAGTTTRTLRVWVSAHSATGTLQATLSDGSAGPFQDSGLSGPFNGTNEAGLYTITYAAASAGQTLTVQWIESASADFTFYADNVAIYARRAGRRQRAWWQLRTAEARSPSSTRTMPERDPFGRQS